LSDEDQKTIIQIASDALLKLNFIAEPQLAETKQTQPDKAIAMGS
jgi:hypothetical protein